MEKIICFINMFVAEAKVYRLDEADNQDLINVIPVERLADGLATISTNSNINHIVLIGAPTYADAIVPDIIEYAKTNFNNNDLIVEVMR